MSGVYIKGMAMPKTPLLVCIYPNGICSDEEGMTYRAASVPPHGRLIDADTIGLTDFEIILCKQEQEPYKEALKMILDKIEKSPTIIPKD